MSESFQQEDSKQRETEEEKLQDEEDEDIVRGVILLSCVAVNYLDTAGISMLRRFAESCEKENVRSAVKMSEISRTKTNKRTRTSGTTLLLRLESELQSDIVPICTRD
jgi:ribosomal protein S21